MDLTRRTLSKVPEITALFWVTKLLTTAMGESTSDYLVHTVNPYLAVIGGFVGVIVGVPVPIIGPVIAGLLGTFLGALIGELESGAPHLTAARAAIGALLGRVAASAMKVAIGVAIAAWLVVAAIR